MPLKQPATLPPCPVDPITASRPWVPEPVAGGPHSVICASQSTRYLGKLPGLLMGELQPGPPLGSATQMTRVPRSDLHLWNSFFQIRDPSENYEVKTAGVAPWLNINL